LTFITTQFVSSVELSICIYKLNSWRFTSSGTTRRKTWIFISTAVRKSNGSYSNIFEKKWTVCDYLQLLKYSNITTASAFPQQPWHHHKTARSRRAQKGDSSF
jgi:hypothetical protein